MTSDKMYIFSSPPLISKPTAGAWAGMNTGPMWSWWWSQLLLTKLDQGRTIGREAGRTECGGATFYVGKRTMVDDEQLDVLAGKDLMD